MDQRPTDDDLRDLLTRAVADVEPADRLADVRERVRPGARSRPGRWVFAGAAGLATAAVLAVALVPAALRDREEPPPVVGSEVATATYYLGETPRGTRLYRERDRVTAASPLEAALAELQSEPADPDYRTPWAGAFKGASYDDGVVRVELADASWEDRPAGMGEPEAVLAIQQVVHTLSAAANGSRAVEFRVDGAPAERVLGVGQSGAVARQPQNEVLALVSIDDPAEGARVGGSLTASGRANSHEATVPWEVRRGEEVVLSGFATATGWMDRLYPWRATVDVSRLDPGTYTFVASTSDPSDGEGYGPESDTRTIVVERPDAAR